MRTGWLLIPLAAGALWATVHYLLGRQSVDDAATKADRFFNLKEALVSAVGFRRGRQSGGIYDLQAEQTAAHVGRAQLGHIRANKPWIMIIATVLLLISSGWLSTFSDSTKVQNRKLDEAQTQNKTEQIKDLLNKAVEELEASLDEQQKELFDKSGLRQMVEKLAATKDRKDALRQYARIEKQMRQMSARAETERDQRFLSEAAKDLNKSDRNRQLAKNFRQKQYAQAAKTLEKMKPKDLDKLAAKRQKFDRLKQATRSMQRTSERMADSQSQFKSLSENLNQSTSQAEKTLCQAEKQMCKSGSCEKLTMAKLDEESKSCASELGKMSRALRKLDAKKIFLTDMKELEDYLRKCEGYLAGTCDKPGSMPKRGIGSADDGRLADRDPTQDPRGLDTRLFGQKGSGPSSVSVEDASSGSGVTSLTAAGKRSQFRKQVESLVRREDVPENLKDGVKNYFQSIHQVTPAR